MRCFLIFFKIKSFDFQEIITYFVLVQLGYLSFYVDILLGLSLFWNLCRKYTLLSNTSLYNSHNLIVLNV